MILISQVISTFQRSLIISIGLLIFLSHLHTSSIFFIVLLTNFVAVILLFSLSQLIFELHQHLFQPIF